MGLIDINTNLDFSRARAGRLKPNLFSHLYMGILFSSQMAALYPTLVILPGFKLVPLAAT